MLFETAGACIAAGTHSRITSSSTGLREVEPLAHGRVVVQQLVGRQGEQCHGRHCTDSRVGHRSAALARWSWHYGNAMTRRSSSGTVIFRHRWVAAGARRPGEAARSRSIEVNLFRGDLARREPPARVRRPGRRAGTGRRGPNDRRTQPAGALAARLLPAPGRPHLPILYEVDRIRDGRSFSTRRVVAIQHGRAIFNLQASFHAHEPGPRPSAGDARGDGPTPKTSPDFKTRMAPYKPTSWVSCITGRGRSICGTSTAIRSVARASRRPHSTSGSVPTGSSRTIPCSMPASSPTPAT